MQKTDNNIYNSKDYRISKNAYKFQCLFEYFIALMMTDAFLAKLLTDVGLTQAQTGVVSSLISFSFLFQLVSFTFVDKIKSVKKTSIIIDTLSQLLFLSLYIIPIFGISQKTKATVIPVILICAYFCLYIINNLCYQWGNSYVEPHKRATFTAEKEMISLIGGVVFTLLMGRVVDKFEAAGNLHGAFLFIAGCMLIISVCNFICLVTMKDMKPREKVEQKSIRDIYKNTLGDKRYRYFIILAAFDGIATYMINGFMGVYKTETLGLSMQTVQIINTAACLVRFAISRPFGKYSDKKSFANGHALGLIVFAAALVFNIFAAPGSVWCVVVYTVFYNASLAGTSANLINMTYSYVDEGYFVHGMAICNAIKGVLGFVTSLVAGSVVKFVEGNGNMFMGFNVYGQQVLSVFSLVIVVCAVLFNVLVVSKQKVDVK